MNDKTIQHYNELLADHYTWMIGMPFDAKVDEQRTVLQSLGIAPGHHGTALDLGSGPGFQAIALAELGFERVLALDTSRALLDELVEHTGDLPIDVIEQDLRHFDHLVAPGSVEAIVCMGDTLTHLDDETDVAKLFKEARMALQPDGLIILTFRDLSTELAGLDRFLPIRSDADRIMTCVLEYEPATVVVNDLVHLRGPDGWTLHKSIYCKLRLGPDRVVEMLTAVGFTVLRNEPLGRMHAIVAQS